jgi:hypothetical protein
MPKPFCPSMEAVDLKGMKVPRPPVEGLTRKEYQ